MPSAAPPQFDATELVWIWDPAQARILWATEAAVAFWGERSLSDLQSRPFLPADPNTQAMNALMDPNPMDTPGEETREATLTFFPDGAPVRLSCYGLTRRRDDARSVWIAIHASPPPSDPSARGERAAGGRAELLLDGAETAFALTDADGAPLFLNSAARRLFDLVKDDKPPRSLFDRLLEPQRARRAANAALMRGAFAHSADICAGAGAGRALLLYRRLIDPETGEALLSLEATPKPGRPSWTGDAVAPSLDDPRIGVALFDAASLTLREANDAIKRMLGEDAARRGARLLDLFPEQADALAAMTEALRSDGEIRTLDLPLGEDPTRGPWGAARVRLAGVPGEPAILLTMVDLGPERRRLLLADQERAAAETALAGLGVGLLFIGAQGELRRANAIAAAALGLDAPALTRAIDSRLALPDLLSAPWGERLKDRLSALFADPEAASPLADQPIEALIRNSEGGATTARLSLSQPLAFGRSELCVAIDLSDRPASPRELTALSAADPRAATTEGAGPSRTNRPAASPRAIQSVSHSFRTALTTIKGFAELARDDAAEPVTARQRQRLVDIVATASALTALVDRLFDDQAEPGAALEPTPTPLVDLNGLVNAAASRAGARHPVWSLPAQQPVRVAAAQTDLDEALDILLAEAADRGPVRLTCEAVDEDASLAARIEIDAATEQPGAWPPLVLRSAELLIERGGGALQIEEVSAQETGIARLRIVFGATELA